ncbi:MAG: hypothetical protein A3C07_02030 [Candidatus Sungbacteria bacterium RIFCSPHIGHO2_02_FULL_47_11]|uniref:Phosphoribulokinase/uridine kinase domain-containing protein n=1 Tax=Candidatus Sungbacteria bacterium RIFCSPHIGHO2_02_FULL_47_11 TaxID=1802270 RepID=A0A1G2KQQ3_9BACT|nr:MAG: hypothetical protein A3C07_02030 [Candidatus Sungbacteria bacterium RIFCSPHIGHO2_02_FULL_47_11]
MKPVFIGIAGGTGSGKSTFCTAIHDKYPDTVGFVHLDDYFKPSTEVPKFEGMENWDHPDALDFNKLAQNLSELTQGKSVIINTKSGRFNPDFPNTGKRIPIEFLSKPIMLVEGFLVLWDKKVRVFFTTSIWFDLEHNTRWARRVWFKGPIYEEKVLIPMHKKFVEPTKQYAEHVIDVSNLTKEQVLEKVEKIVLAFL